ncbi:MAG: DUF4013 domain-containing protein [Anaerolineae bacterium]|nr:DUF4013 domain-containing protein [Anaerolineae bacterium]
MSSSFTTDNLQALAEYPFKDPEWKQKLLIGGLLLFAGYIIPFIPMIFVYGYVAQIMHRIIVEQGAPFLPAWDDWGRLFSDGLKIVGVTFIYSLPAIIFVCGGYAFFFGSAVFIEIMTNSGGGGDTLAPLIPLVSMAIFFGGFSLGMLSLLVAILVMPVAVGHLIATGEFNAAFRVREYWPIFRANMAGFLISYVLLFGLFMLLSFVMNIFYFTIILCCFVPFISAAISIYMMIIGSVLFAEAYRDGVQTLQSEATPLPS